MRLVVTVAVAGLGLAFVLSFFHPWGNPRIVESSKAPLMPDAEVTPEVRDVLVNKCGDCHSNATRWPAYARVAPASWLLERDVIEARQHMNLSRWQDYDNDTRIDLLAKIAVQVRKGQMPLPRYLVLHPEAKLSDADKALIISWSKVERSRLRASLEPKQ